MASSAIISSLGAGVCLIHGPMVGIVVTGAGTKIIENNSAARVSDFIMGYCGDIGILVSGESTVTVENQNQSTIGSSFSGIFSGVITTGAITHNTGT